MQAPKQNPIKTFWNLSLKFKGIIIEGALYAGAISFILVILIILGPEVMGCLVLIFFELILISLAILGFHRYFGG